MKKHVVALDTLRTFVTVLVIAHHAALAYCTFGHFDAEHYLASTAPIVDASQWRGFDLFVVFNDGFFMPLMFLLSGLFVLPGLRRKGPAAFARDRTLRLGLPFAVAVALVMPLAHYPSFRMTGSDAGFGAYWLGCVTTGPWPGGPAWFIWVLLTLDVLAALAFSPRTDEWTRRAARALGRPSVAFAALAAASIVVYLPPLAVWGPYRWFAAGPFAVQASRALLYGLYFAAGAVAGANGVETGPFSEDGPLARRWPTWVGLAAALFGAVVAMIVTGRGAGPAYGVVFVLSCAASSFAALAAFLRFARRPSTALEWARDGAYGAYLVHYVPVVWLQYWLLGAAMPAVAKGVTVFVVAATVSWLAVAALRRIPDVRSMI